MVTTDKTSCFTGGMEINQTRYENKRLKVDSRGRPLDLCLCNFNCTKR